MRLRVAVAVAVAFPLPLLPAAFLGHWVARRYLYQIPQARVRMVSLSLCAISGLTAVLAYWF